MAHESITICLDASGELTISALERKRHFTRRDFPSLVGPHVRVHVIHHCRRLGPPGAPIVDNNKMISASDGVIIIDHIDNGVRRDVPHDKMRRPLLQRRDNLRAAGD